MSPQGDRRCEKFYRNAIKLRPQYSSAWANLGLVLINTGRCISRTQLFMHPSLSPSLPPSLPLPLPPSPLSLSLSLSFSPSLSLPPSPSPSPPLPLSLPPSLPLTNTQTDQQKQKKLTAQLSDTNQTTSMPTLTWATSVECRAGGRRQYTTSELRSNDDHTIRHCATLWAWPVKNWGHHAILRFVHMKTWEWENGCMGVWGTRVRESCVGGRE